MPMPFQKFQKSWKCWTACVLGQMLKKSTGANFMRMYLHSCLLLATRHIPYSPTP